MKPGKGYLANHCSNLEYRGTFMVPGQEENSGASVPATEHLVYSKRRLSSGCRLVPKGLSEVAL